ncbi:MAG: hypothetical protein V1921_08965 [Candidatus Altiarchaeota archaeon]
MQKQKGSGKKGSYYDEAQKVLEESQRMYNKQQEREGKKRKREYQEQDDAKKAANKMWADFVTKTDESIRKQRKERLEPKDPKARKAVEDVKKKYGDNHWWESDDPEVIVGFQLQEPFLMVSLDELRLAAVAVLGREITPFEVQMGADQFDPKLREIIEKANKAALPQPKNIKGSRTK